MNHLKEKNQAIQGLQSLQNNQKIERRPTYLSVPQRSFKRNPYTSQGLIF